MPKYMKAKFGGTCKDRECGFRFEEGHPIRHYGRGQQYCQKHPAGKGSRAQQTQPTPATAIFSPDLARNIVAAYDKGHLDVGEEDMDLVRSLREGMQRGAEDTECASIAEDLERVERDAERKTQELRELGGVRE